MRRTPLSNEMMKSDGRSADHFGSRPAVHRARVQGLDPYLGRDARPDLTVLPAEQRKGRALRASRPYDRRCPELECR